MGLYLGGNRITLSSGNFIIEDANGDVSISRDLYATRNLRSEDLLLNLDTSAAAGTTDGDLYAALNANGWTGDVGTNTADLKVLLTKLVKMMPSTSSFDNGTILFNDDNHSLSGSVTLSDSAANYDKLEIMFKNNEGFYDSTSVYNPNGKTVTLTTCAITTASTRNIYLKMKSYVISGTTIATSASGSYYRTGQAQVDGSGSVSVSDMITITQVIGYKTMARVMSE